MELGSQLIKNLRDLINPQPEPQYVQKQTFETALCYLLDWPEFQASRGKEGRSRLEQPIPPTPITRGSSKIDALAETAQSEGYNALRESRYFEIGKDTATYRITWGLFTKSTEDIQNRTPDSEATVRITAKRKKQSADGLVVLSAAVAPGMEGNQYLFTKKSNKLIIEQIDPEGPKVTSDPSILKQVSDTVNMLTGFDLGISTPDLIEKVITQTKNGLESQGKE